MSTRTLSNRQRRPFGDWVLHAPQTLRALVRADELWLTVLAAIVGVCAGSVVVAMNGIIQVMHETCSSCPAAAG